jgi:hypothetical protein
MPYRIAAKVVVPPASVETKRIVRYPLVLRIYIVSWFVLGAVVLAALVPSVSLGCERSAAGAVPVCVVRRTKVLWTSSSPVPAQEASVSVVPGNNGESTSSVLLDGERFDVGSPRQSEEIRDRYARFLAAPDTRTLDVPIRSLGWHFALCPAGFLLTLLYFAIAQRRIKITIDVQSGTMQIEHRGLLRKRELRAVQLDSIHDLVMDDLDEEAQGQAISVVSKSGKKERLLEAINIEAREAFDFVEGARARWAERQRDG